jgi:hypothetical protein
MPEPGRTSRWHSADTTATAPRARSATCSRRPRPQPAEDDLPARVALHDDVLGQHSAQLADHGDRLDKLEAGFGHGTDGGPAGDRDTDHDGA